MSDAARFVCRASAVAVAFCMASAAIVIYFLGCAAIAIGVPVGGIFLIAGAPSMSQAPASSMPDPAPDSTSSGFLPDRLDLGDAWTSLVGWVASDMGARFPVVVVGIPLAAVLIGAWVYTRRGGSLAWVNNQLIVLLAPTLVAPSVSTHDADGYYRVDLPTAPMPVLTGLPVQRLATVDPIAASVPGAEVPSSPQVLRNPSRGDRLDLANERAKARPTPPWGDSTRFTGAHQSS